MAKCEICNNETHLNFGKSSGVICKDCAEKNFDSKAHIKNLASSILFIFSVMFLFFAIVLLTSCASFEQYFEKSYQFDVPLKTYVGGQMTLVESGYRNEHSDYIRSGVMQQLIYAGIQQSILQIYYREFSISGTDSYIRDGFTLQLTYDISESDTIRFRNNLIHVLSANSSEIEFIILSNNSQASISNKSISRFNKTGPTPSRVKPPTQQQEECAKKFLIKEPGEWYTVPSEEAYKKYAKCRELQF